MRIFVFLFLTALSLQLQAFQFEHLNGVVHDSNDNFYLSSHNGVYRYDGRHFLPLSKAAGLPSGLVRDIKLQHKTLFSLYSNGDVWLTDLTSLESKKIASVEATKLALTNSSLFTLGKYDVKRIDLDSGVVSTIYSSSSRVLDIDAFANLAYLMTRDGVFIVQDGVIKTVEALSIDNGNLAATPHGVVYFVNNRMSYYSTLQQQLISNMEIHNADNIVFASPYFIYFTDNESVNEITLTDLNITRTGINTKKKNYSKLHVDGKNRVWGLSLNTFEPIEVGLKSSELSLGSKYNVLEGVAGELWVGTTKGIFQKADRNHFEPLTWLNNQISAQAFEVTAFQLFNRGLAIGTNVGTYFVDLASKKITKVHDDYVLNFSVIDNNLHIATNGYGVVEVDSHLKLIVDKKLRQLLPSLEVLDINHSGNYIYASTKQGLLVVDTQEWTHRLFEDGVVVTDSFVTEEGLFAATYGKGVWFKPNSGVWQKLSSPNFVKEFVEFNDNLYLATNNGVHIIERGADHTKLVPGTKAHSFTIGSLKVLGDKLYAASSDFIFELTTAPSVDLYAPKVTSVTLDGKTYLEFSELVSQHPAIEITISDYNFVDQHVNSFEANINDTGWQKLLAAGIQLSNLKPGGYDILFRVENKGRFSDVTALTFNVAAPWYSTPLAISMYAALVFILVIAISVYIYIWVQSFHKVFRNNQRQYQKEDLSDAVLKVAEAKKLCSGNDIMISEGLDKLDQALLKLEPLARGHAALGKEKLSVAIGMLQAHCSYMSDMELNFNISIGETQLKKQLEKDIYSVTYHCIDNALKHSKATQLSLSISKQQDQIHVIISDNGKGMALYSRLHFGLGIYTIKQIAKSYKAKLSIKSSKKGTAIRFVFPLLEIGRPSKEEIQKEVLERMKD
ncbi:sensor histidine kinase [Pseudoalteromonas piscicida]|uniref:sensor histidine kinase n=1 Tax=Pseudoalteromonas piscicida TaxID=43662 RepID=UPI0027E52D64|nr:ATP-binding protein [Pseudoalteromonas piscicida]WMO16543.1 ATP-binding protein [Pseudoalteromonas piscicida]